MTASTPYCTRSAIVIGAMAGMACPACRDSSPGVPKVVVIGFDGMDPVLCERLMDAGELPHLAQLRNGGGYARLGTTIPPQSPVAWATFITGANPGVHGIFDFIHRDPSKQCAPYYSAAETIPGSNGWEVGEHVIPLSFWPFNHTPTQTVLKRGGTPFWDYLDAAGVPVWIYEIPANYPPTPSSHGGVHCLSGMGVPDLSGGYAYQFFSEESFLPKQEEGGLRQAVFFENDRATAKLIGPENPFLKRRPGGLPKPVEIPFAIYRHPTDPAARIDIQDQTVLLREGEWSDWSTVRFDLRMPPFLPGATVPGICRFYLQEVRPNFRLFITPINIDPADPGGQKISEPTDFITDISTELGPFYTTGFQEAYKARFNQVFTDEEYRIQADDVLGERLNLLQYALKHYRDGLLFFYFSGTDLQAHIFWWDSDEKHPVRSTLEARRYHQVVVDLYKRMDAVVGRILDAFGDTATILILSDHGFCNFRRQFNLNTWLRENGYLQPPDCKSLLDPLRGRLVDWSKTKAYGLGLNGLYLNLRGREQHGIVDQQEGDALLQEIAAKLLTYRDPADGTQIVTKVYGARDVYSGSNTAMAPDLIIGYERGYRASWATTLGELTEEIVMDNDMAWSADHCIAADRVPGVLFSNRTFTKRDPSLLDLAPTIIELFGVPGPKTWEGAGVFRSSPTTKGNNSWKETTAWRR